MYVYRYVCVDVCMYVCMHACMHCCVCIFMYTCLHVYMHVCMHVCICMYMYACIVQLWPFSCLFLYVFMNITKVYRHIQRMLHTLTVRFEYGTQVYTNIFVCTYTWSHACLLWSPQRAEAHVNLLMCVHVSSYVRILSSYVCIYVHMYVFIFICVYLSQYACIYLYMYAFIFICMCYLHMYVFIFICMYSSSYVCIYLHMYVPFYMPSLCANVCSLTKPCNQCDWVGSRV
jgi:hypothetical protein